MNETLAKLIALSIVGGVAKALFSSSRSGRGATGAVTNAVVSNLRDLTSDTVEAATKRSTR